MSLLMDALKKAEEAKRQAQSAAASAATHGEPSPASAGGTAGAKTRDRPASLPELPNRLELLDDQFTAPNARAADRRGPAQAAAAAAQEKERQAAAQVFAAKAPASSKPFHLALGLFTVTAVLAIAGYFWWQLQPRSSLIAVAPGERGATPDVSGSAAQAPAGAMSGAASSEAAAVASATGSAPAEWPPTSAGEAPASPKAQARKSPPPRAARRPAATERGRLADAAPPALATLDSESPIRISRSKLQIDPGVANGYRYFQSGDLLAAQREYERALRNDPRNSDALDGLAAISLRQNRSAAAADYYQRALEADPMDATAQAGLINLRGSRDPRQTESRLKALLAAQPGAHAAQFALGNLYAAQGQWRNAQEAYFQAYAADPGDPDYQFNLAVSLEQLRQPKPALQYYQSALAAAAARPAAFDKAQAAARVQELQR